MQPDLDGDSFQQGPNGEAAPVHSDEAHVHGKAQPDPSPAPPAPGPQSTDGTDDGSQADTAPSSPRRLERFKRLATGRKGAWAAVATLCVAVGMVGSVLGAHAVARSNSADVPRAYPRTAEGIARTTAGIVSALNQSIQHQQDLVVSASTYFAGHPNASAAEFTSWMKWAQALRSYPELEKLGLVTLVRAPKPTAASGIPPAVPAAARPYSCFAGVELSRSARRHTPKGLDYCKLTPGLLSSRDSGRSVYTSASAKRGRGLRVFTPVYRGNARPATLAGRRAAFVGWLSQVLVPGVMLRKALLGHPHYAASLRHRSRSSSLVVAGGTSQPDSSSGTFKLHSGWTVRTLGPSPAKTSIFSDAGALALLIAGIALSALIGLLVFLLGTRRARGDAPKIRKLPRSDLYDPLTGLPNRALTLDRAERMVARTGRQSGMLAGALFIDIDWFKQINEKLGRAAGDQLLKIFGQRLVGVVRAEDTVGRFSGDKFVVLVESAARGVRLDSLAGRMIEALHKPIELDEFGPRFFSTASIGVAFGRYAGHEDLLRDAELALTAAKAAGKDRYTLFNANMRTIIESRAVLEDELNTALQEKQFFLLYQPMYDLQTRRVAGFEALIRWVHPKKGVLPAGDFMPLAEDSGQIVPIGRWMLEEACSRAAAWNVAGHRAGVSLEISANQLNRDGFVTDVRRALQQSGIEPSLLTLEIAETTIMRDLAASAERLQEIRQLGVRIAIDDFGGSGYARHSDLQRMPLDVLKVDRSSLAASEDEDYRSWLLEAILVFGRDLSLTVIATGVETEDQMTTLQALGCTMVQGSFMGKPTPTDAVEGLFATELPAARAAVETG